MAALHLLNNGLYLSRRKKNLLRKRQVVLIPQVNQIESP